jgi:hypothetical protein
MSQKVYSVRFLSFDEEIIISNENTFLEGINQNIYNIKNISVKNIEL